MLTRVQLWLIIALTMGFTLLGLRIRAAPLTIESVAATLATTVMLVYGVMLIFALYLWPWRIFRRWLVKRPDLRGSWKATLHSDWTDPVTNQKVPPIEAYVIVRQALATLSMWLFTGKSQSKSIAYSVEPDTDGLFNLSLIYRNEPKIEYQGKGSSIHHGALLIVVHEVWPQRLEGHYWTDRETRGTIVLERKGNAHFSSFEEARRAIGGI